MYIVIRKARDEKERDEVYNLMIEGVPKTTLTLGSKAARLDRGMAEMVAKQLSGMFPAWTWAVAEESAFKYRAAA